MFIILGLSYNLCLLLLVLTKQYQFTLIWTELVLLLALELGVGPETLRMLVAIQTVNNPSVNNCTKPNHSKHKYIKQLKYVSPTGIFSRLITKLETHTKRFLFLMYGKLITYFWPHY